MEEPSALRHAQVIELLMALLHEVLTLCLALSRKRKRRWMMRSPHT